MHRGGLGSAGVAEYVHQGKRLECLGALLGGAQLAIGVVQQQVQLGRGGGAGKFAVLLLFLFGAIVEHQDDHRGRDAQQPARG